MKTLITSLFVCLAYTCFSQSKTLVILDQASKAPIDLVQVYYPGLDIGSISNADGKLKLPLLEHDIVISHINYIEQTMPFNRFKENDTIYLNPKNNQLDEVVIYNLNLKQKFKDILEHSYLKKYATDKVIHSSTYKETFSVNDSLSRIFQAQLDWFSKNSLFKSNSPIDKQNIINLESVDYSKIKTLDSSIATTKAAYVENKIFFQFMHLNLLLELLINLTEDYEIETIEHNKHTNTVYFNAALKQNGELIYTHDKSLIVFDKDYKAIKQLKFNMVYNTDFEDDISRINNIPYKKKTDYHSMELSFHTLKNGKYSISYYISKLNAVIVTEHNTDYIVSEQSLFVTKSRVGEKLKNGNIDFYTPLFENIPKSLNTNDVKILLTTTEKDFLNKSL
ncbi:Cna protein B-type domain protein [Formosa agariphila KMM 3901]|uniref:Cna protein B-type domain protein n=1 Tax=Formosa agariphila (strain DSM 15362 / KCTC 12365 / LMG 23005 / KMM 3901 / M-2Alg 35-1) TaxID=1347342 RepID=T2KLK0_FORAG|nr:carboxypeptidase-like regulatory domain-containing protein [Formosa agariphila]CDF79313.1 Cna protein B-type domain protein [Formosa agariphila KMM 3901]